MPNAAFCTGLQTIAKFEAARVGVQWGDVFMEVSWHNPPQFEMVPLCSIQISGLIRLQQVLQVPLSSPNSLVPGAQSW